MKNNKNLMLLLAAGAAYWYFAIYLKKKKSGLPADRSDIVIKEDLNASLTPTLIPVTQRLQPLAYQPDVVSESNNVYNVKYTLAGSKRLGKVPNTI
jgi:hypothetical protein